MLSRVFRLPYTLYAAFCSNPTAPDHTWVTIRLPISVPTSSLRDVIRISLRAYLGRSGGRRPNEGDNIMGDESKFCLKPERGIDMLPSIQSPARVSLSFNLNLPSSHLERAEQAPTLDSKLRYWYL